jgi:protein-tyrosine sulfotransferase
MSGRGGYALWRRLAGMFRKRSLHFIVGVPRSGTSLCRMLLGCHPRVFAPSETPWLFGAYGDDVSLGALVRVLSTSQYGPARSVAGVSAGDVHAAAEQFILTMFAAPMRAEGKDVLLLKTPDDIAFVDEILEIFSGSIVVHLRRDVRDVALSTIRIGWTRLNLFGENNFDNAVRRWVAWEKKIEAARLRSPERIVSVRYEDLVVKPEQTLRHILQRLRLPFDADMVRYWQREHGAPAWDIGSVQAAQFKAIERTRAFAYRAHVPTEEQRRIVADLQADIVTLGYQPGWAA